MSSGRPLRVIDAAEEFAVDVHRCFGGPSRAKTHADQARRSSASVSENLIEGYGRGPGADRMRFYRFAVSSCEEALGWIRLSHLIHELQKRDFYYLTNRGVTITRMIRALRY